MLLRNEVELALHSPKPIVALRDLVERLLAMGQSRDIILTQFEQIRRALREANRATDEDAVTDAMDFLVGWCSPHMQLPSPPR